MEPVISREQWGARGPKAGMLGRRPDDIVAAVVHYGDFPCRDYFADEIRAMHTIQNYHMDNNGWYDIGYNTVVGMSGNAYAGRDAMWVPAHCLDFNKPSLGICLLSASGASPAACQTVINLIHVAEYLLGRKLEVFYHREKVSTGCPGDQIAQWVASIRDQNGYLTV